MVEEMIENSVRRQPTPLPLGSTAPVFQQPGDCQDISASTHKSEKSRRRGSLSVSRFGQVRRIRWSFSARRSICSLSFTDPRRIRRRRSRSDWHFSLCIRRIIAHSQIPIICSASCEFCGLDHDAFIHSSLQPLQAPSVDSFGSEGEAHEAGPVDDHVTQMRHISGKPSISRTVGGMISRTISTRRSKNNLKVVNPQNLFIGVSVTEHEHEQEVSELENEPETAKKLVVTTVHAPLKKQPSKRTVGSPVAEGQDDWISRARKFGWKIRRKSQAWLTGQGPKPVVAASPTTTATTTTTN